MIEFSYQTDFVLGDEGLFAEWLSSLSQNHDVVIENVGYVFCDDEYLLSINQSYLDHDTYTDIITFDYSKDDVLEGEIYISIDRVMDNAKSFAVPFENELLRVMSHGLLHMLGFRDDTSVAKATMRQEEDKAIQMFHVKQ